MIKKRMSTKKNGFTLVELLVVISIIAVLATLMLANFNSARERARDAQRKADLRNIQTALRLYYNDFGRYPDSSAGQIMGCDDGTSLCGWGDSFKTTANTYMAELPDDPSEGRDYSYLKTSNDEYTLSACLENISDESITNCTKCGPISDGCEYLVGQ